MGVFTASAIRASLGRLVSKSPRGSCVILYYHSVPRDQRGEFAHQLDVLLRYAKPIALSGNLTLTPGVHHVAVTFDDALENFVENALPELTSRRIPATVFAISGALGRRFGAPDYLEQVMSLEQLQELPKDLITVGSHTVTHPFLPAVNKEEARRELRQSRAQLGEILKQDVHLFSFPFGGFTPELTHLCREAGYHRVFTTLPIFAFSTPDEFSVGRVRVDPTDWPLEYRLKLSGSYRWLSWAFTVKDRVRSSKVLARYFPWISLSMKLHAPEAKIQ